MQGVGELRVVGDALWLAVVPVLHGCWWLESALVQTCGRCGGAGGVLVAGWWSQSLCVAVVVVQVMVAHRGDTWWSCVCRVRVAR